MSEISERDAIEIVLQLATEAVPEKGHKGSCASETICDSSCSDNYYSQLAIGIIRQHFTREHPDA